MEELVRGARLHERHTESIQATIQPMAQAPAPEAAGCLGDGESPQRPGGHGYEDVPERPRLVRRRGGGLPGTLEKRGEEPADARVLAIVSELSVDILSSVI